MRIAVSSSSFRRPLASGELTQLEWVERCATVLGVDGILAGVDDFPRIDAEYVAQVRKVAVDLGIVPFGLDARGLLGLPADPDSWERVLALATGMGAMVIRTALPAPGDVPPATFVEAVAAAKAASRAAKAANVTLIVAAAPGTLGEDLAAIKHLLKDVDSAWLRACPRSIDAAELGPKDRVPAFEATVADEPEAVARAARRTWAILDAPAGERPWDVLAGAIDALRRAPW
ncbi:MAG: hypothetical protein NVS3B7_04710 [Candidatus Elarobacter sp.]